MTKPNGAHEVVLESLTTALLVLMESKRLKSINVSELCKKAGVGRVSFYRNFSSVEDILIRYFTACTDDWWILFSQKSPEVIFYTFWEELLALYKRNEKLIKMIYDNDASYILKDHIFSCCKPVDLSEKAIYDNAALSGALFGLIDIWIRRGMDSFPIDFSLSTISDSLLAGVKI